MEITENYSEKTGLYVRTGFIVSPAAMGEDRDAVEETIVNDHGVSLASLVHFDWNIDGTEVEAMTEYDPEDGYKG